MSWENLQVAQSYLVFLCPDNLCALWTPKQQHGSWKPVLITAEQCTLDFGALAPISDSVLLVWNHEGNPSGIMVQKRALLNILAWGHSFPWKRHNNDGISCWNSVEKRDGELLFFCLPAMVMEIKTNWTKIIKRNLVEPYSELLEARKSNWEVILKVSWKILT